MPETLEAPAPAIVPEFILDEATVAQYASETGIRLNHIESDSHRIRHPDGHWYEFAGHVLIVETEEEARWIEAEFQRIYGRKIIYRDDMPAPWACELCRANGKLWATRCSKLYQRHPVLEHSG